MNDTTQKNETFVRVKDTAGNTFICAIDDLKDIENATSDELANCVDDGTVGRYAGNIDIKDE